MTMSERERFLDGNVTIVKDVKALPRPVLQQLTEEGGSGLLMANPGGHERPLRVAQEDSCPEI